MSVKTTHKDYDRFAPKWKRCRDVVAGQDAVHAAGTAYLPKLKDEGDDDYKARIARSDFFNGTWRTIDGLGGMAFRKPPTVDVPKGIEAYLADVNMAGVALGPFAAEIVEEVMSVGRVGILVDHPPMPAKTRPITVDAAQKMGLRPTLQVYMTESIINWKFARINNAWTLSLVVLKECEEVPDGEFKTKSEDRYRVLDLGEGGFYRQRVFAIGEKGEDVLLSEFTPLMNGKPLTYIPFAILGAGGRGDTIDEPPLIDLVDKNIAHYQINADYRHGLHFTGLPTLFLAGMDPPTEGSPRYYIGSSAAIQASHPDAKASFVEFTGQGLNAIKDALDRVEKQMALLGARMIADETKQVETLGATQIKRAGENSILSKIVQAVSDGLEWSLGIFAQWAGQAGKIVYQINRDFNPMMLDAQQLTALLAMVQAGKLSDESFFDLIQRGDLVKADVTFDEEQARIDAGGPPRPVTKPANDGGIAA